MKLFLFAAPPTAPPQETAGNSIQPGLTPVKRHLEHTQVSRQTQETKASIEIQADTGKACIEGGTLGLKAFPSPSIWRPVRDLVSDLQLDYTKEHINFLDHLSTINYEMQDSRRLKR